MLVNLPDRSSQEPSIATTTLQRLRPAAAASFDHRLRLAQRHWSLTPRQLQVLAMLSIGASNKEIAAALLCSEVTVEFHVTALFRRSGADRRAILVAKLWLELEE